MSFALTESKDGVLLLVRVKPRARTNTIEGAREGVLLISVSAAPADGAANAAVIAVLARALGVGRNTLFLSRGHKSRDKMICSSTLSAEEIRLRLTIAVPAD